ncbi:hypothetical protein SUGI_1018930 [Cryptomeria japonica]|uniref:transcription factor MYB28-like n=1 Tax=Cryptomeria japonica TaxID=3369 RepID=UPI00241476A6|nr:transcription factor MYB28-like [Cryptomeria japonica]GLJ48265.1 hypothetical protein SUGI_1018930 [Cryptomeria japonica]
MRSIGDDHSGKRLKKGQWTPEEDLLLTKYIETHGEGNWRTLPQKAGLQRCGKGCRLRWKNYLRPNVKRGNISLEEEDLIIRLHKLLGNRWSLIAGRVPGRTDNEIKKYWKSRLSKKLRHNVIHETPNHYKASSSPSDHLQLHSYEKDLIDSESLYGYSSLPDCKMDYLDSQKHSHEGDHLKVRDFNISQVTDSQIDPSSHVACAFQRPPHTSVEDSSTRFYHVLSANQEVGVSTEDWLQQPLPPSGHFFERNGHAFYSMVAMQPKYCPSSSLCIDGCYDEIWDHNDLGGDHRDHYDEIWDHDDLGSGYNSCYDEIWEHNDLGCTDFELLSTFCEDSITTDFGEFGGDVQSMNSILGWNNSHNNSNSVEENPCHDLHTLQVMHPIISLHEHSEQCTYGSNFEDKADTFPQVTEMNASTTANF